MPKRRIRVSSEVLQARLRVLFGEELRIDRELGRGGMAAVFLAHDPALDRQVAVKLLLPEASVHGDVVERFLREARTVAALQHPHIVTVYGVRSRDDAHAIVMQFVDGSSLDTVVAEQGALPPARAARMLSQVAAGLQHAHDRGVVHRDVKPGNVLLDDQGNAYVSDFGIARRDDGTIVTKTGLVLGSWDYMSPEQRAGERVTAAADQYAFGVMAFEVLSGRLPFPGTPAEVIRGHMETPPPSIRAIVPALPAAVDTLITRMLAKNPEHRWPSLVEARRRLDALAEGGLAAAVPGPAASSEPSASGDVGRYVAVGAVVVLLAAVAAWAFGLFTRPAPGIPGASPTVVAPTTAPAAASVAPVEPSVAPIGTLPVSPPSVPPRAAGGLVAGSAAARLPGRAAPATSRATSRATVPAPGVTPPAPAPSAEPAPTTPAPTTPAPTTSASIADARRMGRAFVTLLNQRQTRAIAQLAPMGGDGSARAELLRLTESAPEFAAGFDRLPSPPDATADGFETEFHLDLEWRGGRTRMRVRLFVAQADGGFTLKGFAVSTIE